MGEQMAEGSYSIWTYRGSRARARTWARTSAWLVPVAALFLMIWWVLVLPPVALVRLLRSGPKRPLSWRLGADAHQESAMYEARKSGHSGL